MSADAPPSPDPRRAGARAALGLFALGVAVYGAVGRVRPEAVVPGAVRDADAGSVAGSAGAAHTPMSAVGLADASVEDAGPAFVRPTRVIALGVWTPVHREPRRDAHNAGYLRAGAVVDVIDGPHGHDGCPSRRDHPEGGWYQITGGGYVCVGGAMVSPWPDRGYRPPVQPDLDAGMPYTYAVNYGRAMMYRRPPTLADLRTYEPWRFPQRTADAGAGTGAEMDSGVDPSADPTDPGAPPPPPAPAPVAQTTPRDAGQVRLSDLAGERGGPVIRRMLTGMYVALDRTVRDGALGESYWRTQSGGFVRTGPLAPLRSWPTFRGMELDAARGLPVAWMVSETGWDYTVSPAGRSVSSHHRVPRLTGIPLSDDPPIAQGGQTYYRTVDGQAVAARNVRRAVLRPPPAGVGPAERWMDVDLDEQVLVAYEGPRPVFATLVSSGRRDEHRPERNFETPIGSFRVQGKHVTTTMDGDTATDGPYSIEDVPWVMYFQGSYALHAAFWHNFFGWRMSHGCVNLAPEDARRLFAWADPPLPAGWHGVFANDDHPGSRVELRHSRANAREEGRPAGAARAVPAETQ